MQARQTAGPRIDSRRYDAVVFDMDGVVTDSAAIHASVWGQLFDTFLATRAPTVGIDLSPFTQSDYERFFDDKPRDGGIADFLASRGIALPWGMPTDPVDAATVCGLGNREDQLFLRRISRDGVPSFASTVALVRRLRAAGIRTAVFSASRHSAQVLDAAGIDDLFRVRVDGLVTESLALPGRPDPAIVLEATRQLGCDPERTVVVENAEAGVTAGRRGGFGLVIGVDRVGRTDRLRTGGADAVVTDAAQIALFTGFRRMSELPDAIAHWLRIDDLLDVGKSAVLLDFDGTLADIVADPAAASLVDGLQAILARLIRQCPVAIISGRDLDDLLSRVDLPGIWYAGCHGFELLAPDGSRHVPDCGLSAEPAIAHAVGELDHRLRDVPGVLIERKRFAVAVHHRNVAEQRIATVVAAAYEVGRDAGLRVYNGRKVTELRPDVDWDKGTAVDWILDRLGVPALPIYVGDDLTDEDAFDVIASDGIPIVVRDAESRDRPTGAHYAVDSPAGVRDLLRRLAEFLSGEITSTTAESWTLNFDGYDPRSEKLREALCTVGNGYIGTRGAAPECRAGTAHYPGTYVAGTYNRLRDEFAGRAVDNESMVNLPNWLPVTWRIDDGAWFDIDATELQCYRQQLDLRCALLTREFRCRDDVGRITTVVQRRFAAMHAPHICALETTLTAENWRGRLTFRSGVDAAVGNTLVDRYRDLSSDHLSPIVLTRPSPRTVLAVVETNQSHVEIATAVRSTLRRGGEIVSTTTHDVESAGLVGHDVGIEMDVGQTVTLEKVVTIYTSRDHAVSAPGEQALRTLDDLGGWTELLASHTAVWEHLWARMRIDLDGSADAVRTVRLHLLHLVQTLSPHTIDLDVGVPARGLHGEAYRGHVFWDELFVLPVLNIHFPTLTRSLLRYRYRRLPEARRSARALGRLGALFPWQSGSDGREESQQLHLNPRSGRWNPDSSNRAHHAGVAVAFNVWQYYQVTGDTGFLAESGAELLVEIARFWASSATYDRGDDRYHIRGVIGPDEFHSGYPHAPDDGVDDNAYTNVMSAWVIRRAHDALRQLAPRVRAELLESLQIPPSEPAHWAEIADRMFIPFHDGVISQFAGYDALAEFDWDGYRRRYGDIGRLDRILDAEGDDVNRYRVAKQADVVMLFYLLSADELRELLGGMGYELPGEMIPRTVDYYRARTSHGSTLSAVVHSWVLARANRDRAMDFFATVLESDIADIQGGTTAEGIHLAAMAGSVDLLQRCFTGLEIRGGRLIFNPRWPQSLGALSFPIVYRGHRLTVRIDADTVEVASDPDHAQAVEIECRNKRYRLEAGGTVRF
ncbi:trehalose-phosphatase [Nocardia sp. NPDC049190]|uniref:trehalose-phosphatase n=1 Tax=Nocardia sp. NPDC049190 TaxID=3155650 RepID=UPI0033EC47A0